MNRTLSLVRYAAIDGKGWRRGRVVMTRNGKLKADTMILSGAEVHCPNGCFQIRRYENKRPVYTDVGNEPTDALNRFRAEQAKLELRIAAAKAGIALTPEADDRKSLKKLAADFVEMHENLPHRADDSVRVYTAVTTSFIAQAKALYHEQVTKEDVIRWHGWMREHKGYSDRTCADRYMSLRGFLRYCGIDPGKLIPKGTHTLLKQYTKKKVVNTYTPETVQKLIEASTDENRALLWDFAYKTGLRDSELQMVTRYDLHGLDTDAPMLHVKERDEYGHIKDAEERKIELHPTLVPRLKTWLKENPKKVLLFGTKADKPDTKMLLALKATARRAGLNCGHCTGCKGKLKQCREFTLHRFRRTYTTRMLRASGGDLRSVMERTGHSDMDSVMRYLEPAKQFRDALVQAF